MFIVNLIKGDSMNLFDNLAAHGLTIDVLQVLIISAIFVVLIGMYWQFFAIGIGFLFCVYVFGGDTLPKTHELNEWKETKLEKIEDQRKEEFLKDCQSLGDSFARCMNIWSNKEIFNDNNKE